MTSIPPGAFERHHVQTSGSGPDTLLFGHGLGGDGRAWRFVRPAFESTHRTAVMDHIGSGASLASAYDPARHATLDGYAEDLVSVIEALDDGPVTYVGHSVGGMIGILAAIRRPDLFTRLVTIASSPCFVDHPPDYQGGFSAEQLDQLFELLQRNQLGWADAIAPMAMGEEAGPGLTCELRDGLGALNPLIARRFGRLAFYSDLRDRVDQLRVPTLLVQCERDAAVPPAVGEFLHARIPDSRLLVLPVAGHCPHLSHPAVTLEAIRPFVEAERAG